MMKTHPFACPRCSKPVDVKSRHVSVAGSSIEIYCSDACLRDVAVLDTAIEVEEPPRRRRWWMAAGVAFGGVLVVMYAVHRDDVGAETGELAAVPMVFPSSAGALPLLPAAPPGPSPEEQARQDADEALLKELMQDAWIHPLAGPQRRMPSNHNGAFGAVRNNAPPPECLSGHCGVDVGRVWGEPIHAVHDGVIDFVNRGPNEDNGGAFVKISHRDGTLFSWYFHLAAIPRWVQPGAKVTVGRVVGLLGDTGIKISAPHLHFAMTVKADKLARERYIDPEPLIAIWPLWLPDEQKVSTNVAPPGIPVRVPARGKSRAARPPEPASQLDAAKLDAAKLDVSAPPLVDVATPAFGGLAPN